MQKDKNILIKLLQVQYGILTREHRLKQAKPFWKTNTDTSINSDKLKQNLIITEEKKTNLTYLNRKIYKIVPSMNCPIKFLQSSR